MTDKKQPSKNTKKQPSKNNKNTTKKPVKKPTAPVNKGGRPPGKMSEEAKFVRDTKARLRQLAKISEAHLPAAMEDLNAARVVGSLIKTTQDIQSSLFDNNGANVAVQINHNGEKTNTEEVLKILQKKHKELKK